jgi:anti-sigma regulatory factor (Ser/Thr protein kinase)
MSVIGRKDLSLSLPAVAHSVAAARQALTRFAATAGIGGGRLEFIRLAVSEAISNVVLHAYRDLPDGEIHLTAAVMSGELWVLVADDGCGLHPRIDSPGLGFGLAIIAEACDELAVMQRSGGGTELRMRFNVAADRLGGGDQSRGSVASATRPASSTFSTTA